MINNHGGASYSSSVNTGSNHPQDLGEQCSLARQQVAAYDKAMNEMQRNGSLKFQQHRQAYNLYSKARTLNIQWIQANCK